MVWGTENRTAARSSQRMDSRRKRRGCYLRRRPHLPARLDDFTSYTIVFAQDDVVIRRRTSQAGVAPSPGAAGHRRVLGRRQTLETLVDRV
jgi:hypothetical protein